MHEMSIVQSLQDIIRQEMGRHGVTRLLAVRVVHGRLTNVVPEALEFAWEVMTKDTDMEGARLETEEIPLKLRCGGCRREFEPEDITAVLAPCPVCGEQIGHEVVAGRELHIAHIEAE
ncbi:hydrogenase maturation nickel metallochaperone HypA [Desulfovibrio sp. X2]|uniref:hydrogenase maturation nickel metallochaperone HypA/HybF n=1 Tax=Desulfovibrio sp. X2 TaxID=941449 RepID=UPI000552819D|nr:hydrogenase maturation nickel metallochaperone HypA [Desulfovibrio sp. X2]